MTIFQYVIDIWKRVMGIQADEKQELSQLDRLEKKVDGLVVAIARVLSLVGPGPTASVSVVLTLPSGQTQTGDEMAQIKDTQQITFSLTPVDSKGQPSTVDPTKTTLTPDNAAVASVVVNPDGISGTIVAGTVGSTQITGSVTDANNPADVVAISPISLTVVAGDTATVAVNLGDPTAQ